VTPYADFLYFGVLLYIVVPALLFGALGRFSRAWVALATAGLLVVQYWPKQTVWAHTAVRGIWLVLGFAASQWLVAAVFAALRRRKKSRLAFYAAILLALAPLAALKLVPRFVPSWELGFLGISYVTFRTLDVIIGIHDGLKLSVRPDRYLAYLLFIPTISSGPIDRYRRFLQDFQKDRSRAEFLQDLDGAVHRIIRGFLYKFILAALIKQHWLDVAAKGTGFLPTVSYMYAYSFYLFFDFAGYSAFAVGLSYLLGIHTPENFDKPFLARNIRDFWNRWHISLSWWFRDHVYTRLVFAAAKGHWFKSGYVASYLGFVLSMGLMGLWHGTAWHFIIYGLFHGTLLVAHDLFVRWNKTHNLWGDGPIWQALSIAITFNVICFGLLIFSGRLG
jgi:membrane protein involved in D-alanine export